MTTLTTPQMDIPRDRWSRPLVIPPGGGKAIPYTRCTTFVSVTEDTYNLNRWSQRMVATGLAQRPDLLLAVSAHSDDKREMDRICEAAREHAKASAAATTGTALHALTERLDRGEEMPTIPDAYRADLDAYQTATAGLTAQHIEQFSVVDDLKVGGTPDRIVTIDGHDRPVVADIKTGSIEYGAAKIAMQLAMYAHAVGYDHTTGARFSLGDVDTERALIIHLPAGEGRCELVWVDIAAGWEGVHLAGAVREWRKRKYGDLTEPYTSATSGGDPIAAALHAAATVDDLYAVWRRHAATFTDKHTALAAVRKAELTA